MFIKKDLRKIPQIFDDASKSEDEKLTELRLARRPAEFNGSISALCQPQFAPSLQNLTSLSLYECQLNTLEGMDFFAQSCPNMEKMNLGRNPLTSLPDSIGLMQNLKGIWLDDCEIEGQIPACLSRLENLEVLRMSNNRISELNDDTVRKWKKMEVLCLDGNLIPTIPKEIVNLTNLKMFLVRKNKIKTLPEGVPGATHVNLTLFHISSNELPSLPSSICECPSLTTIYANANKIDKLPINFSRIKSLTSCNLSNNLITTLSSDFVERFGEPANTDGKCIKDEDCCIQLEQNPVVKNEALAQNAIPMEVC